MAQNQRGRGRVRDGTVAPPQRLLDRNRLKLLLGGVAAVSADLDTRTVLRRIVQTATDLVAARYGALGVLSEDGAVIDLITVGIDDPELCARMGMPKGLGLLHTMVADQAPLSVARPARYPGGHRRVCAPVQP